MKHSSFSSLVYFSENFQIPCNSTNTCIIQEKPNAIHKKLGELPKHWSALPFRVFSPNQELLNIKQRVDSLIAKRQIHAINLEISIHLKDFIFIQKSLGKRRFPALLWGHATGLSPVTHLAKFIETSVPSNCATTSKSLGNRRIITAKRSWTWESKVDSHPP